jgi:hypothetical protein
MHERGNLIFVHIGGNASKFFSNKDFVTFPRISKTDVLLSCYRQNVKLTMFNKTVKSQNLLHYANYIQVTQLYRIS